MIQLYDINTQHTHTHTHKVTYQRERAEILHPTTIMDTPSTPNFFSKLKAYDRHSSIADEFRVRTKNGALLSILTIASITYLIYLECKFNLFETVVEDRVHVNATVPSGLPVDFSLTFPNLACALIATDATDPAGQLQSLHLDRTHHVFKVRMKNGKDISKPNKHATGGTMKDEASLEDHADIRVGQNLEKMGGFDDDYCGSCYGAEDNDNECCNTCDDVKQAYKRKQWHLNLEGVEQCKNEALIAEEQDEGCRVYGRISLSTGGGNFHFAPSHELESTGHENKLTVFDYISFTFEDFDVTHTIDYLHFGEKGKFFPNQVHQLDGETRKIDDGHGMYQYYVQVVPTRYKYLDGSQVETFQFSVTEHLRHVAPGQGRGLPGVFFFYEVSALHVEFEEQRKGWIRFFTSVCAVVGGVFTFVQVMDQMLWKYDRRTGNHSRMAR